ncbi:hypothetical protein BN2475_420015 [Paraburkholderia ribeironis]|uniref:Uncharacterized protein n=1 Tax=Paraburkholderia ribeironis TaxID=1247936 RepID=A0A1N7S7H4_9BURK|nr:hypothetical protein BN2475_420015 [Paraburkholderia ribeironis]
MKDLSISTDRDISVGLVIPQRFTSLPSVVLKRIPAYCSTKRYALLSLVVMKNI